MRRGWVDLELAAVLLLAAEIAATTLCAAQSRDLPVEELYRLGCASCHGAGGEGLAPDHPNYANFDPLPADLGNALFNSREPGADWFLVVKYGGKALGLSDQMPAYGEAFDDDQIRALVGYLKALPADASRYPPGDLNFPRAVRTIKAFPEDEALLLWRYESDDGPDALRTTAYWARRLGARFQIEVKGARTAETAGEREDELELGLKWAFWDDPERALLLASGLETEIPLDGGDEVWAPYLSVAKGISAKTTFQGTVRGELPGGDPGAGVVELSGVVHRATSIWPRSATPGLEAVVRLPLASGEDVEASLLPQVLVGLTKRAHVAVAFGAELPVTGIEWNRRYHAFLLWDIADGPFWKGW